MALGARKENILMLDSKGVITSDRDNLNEQKRFFATDRRDVHTLAEAINGADVFVGLSKGNVLTKEMVKTMAKDPIIFALANPVPEISYEDAMEARPDTLMSTGRTDYPNQINNVIGFPYIFRGALDVHATAINEEMKMAAVHAIADLAKQPVPDVVNDVYKVNNLKFGRDYFIPKPVDPRLISEVSAAVAKAAIESGVARKTIEDWEGYKNSLSVLLGQETKLTQKLYATASAHPQRVVFAEGIHPTMLRAAVQAKAEGICQPILLGNDERIAKLAKELDLSLEGIEVINLRHDNEAERRERFARILTQKRQRDGYTFEEANDKMFERNYFGMMMVETGEADAFITGLYTKYSNTIKVAKEVIGIRSEYKHFGTMHIINSPKGTLYIADTLINNNPDTEELVDLAKLSSTAVRFFNEKPVIAMVSHSNFGSDTSEGSKKVRKAVAELQAENPEMIVDGEIQIGFALNREQRDTLYPFTRLKDKDVNTLIFPNLTSARSSYKMLQALDADVEIIGPIQMGLNKPIHFTDFGSSVRDVVNITAVAVIDAYVDKIKNRIKR
jgi:malate dehydrogenase (oxaloacetate-decarboxylating)(NADP+)